VRTFLDTNILIYTQDTFRWTQMPDDLRLGNALKGPGAGEGAVFTAEDAEAGLTTLPLKHILYHAKLWDEQ